ncbi:MAG: bifunctional phosphoglucose/phosphomannose isomerase [Chlorobiaceae bacterium]|nr:bifunctional phosphoglucose/phosphomannose isomerase [Chlorobiaceae bacterium]
MNKQSIQRYDKSNMNQLLVDFPKQVENAVKIGNKFKPAYNKSQIDSVVITGLGGSAIGGDLIRSYLSAESEIPFHVNRHYFMPEFVNERTLVVVSSYSGNTEETIAAHADAKKRKAKILCISSDGQTAASAEKFKQPLITIPKGLPPRAALGYSFFPTLIALSKMKLIRSKNPDIKETLSLLQKKSKIYSSLNNTNTALQLAKQLYMKLPVIYSAADRFDIVNLRWRGQIAENAKQLAFGHVLPEMNHNELVGWKVLRRMMEEEIAVIFLRDKDDHPRVKLRMEITKSVIEQYASKVIEIQSEGKSVLARMFSLIYLGDWTSYYLAILNGIDPTPVKVIDYLKNELGKM